MTMNETDSAIHTVGSLCSGIGGLDKAVPGEVTWMAETNQAASRVLKREHPGAPNFGDIVTTDWNWRQHHVDLLTSGDPCQSMSVAGRQMASGDERFLWPDVMNVIDILRPRELFLENVQNLVSVALVKGATDWRGQKGSVLKLRLTDLRKAGYAARWTVLGACAVGAPHHRHRWFLRAVHVGAGAPEAVRVLSRCGAPRTGGRVLLPMPAARDFKGKLDGKRVGGPNLNNVVALLPTPRATDVGTPGRRSSEGWRPQLGQAIQALEGTWGKFAEAVALWESITGRPAPDPTVPAPRGGRRLNPALSEWMMGYPDGYVTGELERSAALRAIGNGVVPLQGATAWDLLA
jgi:DNA (cytosine-5)-methyltransferase 1